MLTKIRSNPRFALFLNSKDINNCYLDQIEHNNKKYNKYKISDEWDKKKVGHIIICHTI